MELPAYYVSNISAPFMYLGWEISNCLNR